jgi:hypothetical protein
MDRALIAFPAAPHGTHLDPLERDLIEVDAAIELVAAGVSRRIRLVNLSRPDAAAGHAASVAGDLGLDVRLEGETLLIAAPS